MPTKREIGYRLYRRTSSTGVSSASKVGAATGSSTQVRYGYAQADSADGKVPVKLDNSDSIVNCTCDSPIKNGDRVKVIATESGQLIAMPIGDNIVDYTDEVKKDLLQEITDKGNEILESVDKDMQAVNDELEGVRGDVSSAQAAADAAQAAADAAGNKANENASQIDDVKVTVNGVQSDLSSLNTTVEGVSRTATSALSQATSAQQDLNGFKTNVSQTYETKEDADAAMAQEVLDRNSAITQSANSIKQEVAQNYVNNETGATLATKAELTTTANQITAQVNSVSETASSALEQSSAAIQKADEVSTTLETDYLSKADANTTYATRSYVQQTSTTILQQVSEDYQSAESASQMQSQIDQNAQAIKTEVSARQDAVTNAVKESKTYTDQQADSISQTVEQSVMNSVGETYATKSELTQTSTDLTATFTAGLNTKGKMYVRQPVPPYSVGDVYIDPEFGYTYECTTARASGSFVQSDWTQREDIVSGMVRLSGNGVEVGRSDSSYKTVTANDGFIVMYDGSEVARFAPNTTYIGSTETGNPYSYGTLQLYGAKINYSMQSPVSYIGGYLTMSAPIVAMESSYDSSNTSRVMCLNGGMVSFRSNRASGDLVDWVTEHDVSNSSVRYWLWAKERKEACGSVSFDNMAYGEHTATINLPFSYDTNMSYKIFLQVGTLPLTNGSTFNLTKVFAIATSVQKDGFTIYVWNDYNGTENKPSATISWYTIGV